MNVINVGTEFILCCHIVGGGTSRPHSVVVWEYGRGKGVEGLATRVLR